MTITRVERLHWRDEVLANLAMPKGRMLLTRSLTSGLAQSPLDPPGLFWGVGDRGPNIKPKEAVGRYGLDELAPLVALDGAKIMPMAEIGPTLAQFRLTGDCIILERVLPVTTSTGDAISGIAVPSSPHAEHEPVFTLSGSAVVPDPNGADTEGLAILPDGTFLLAEEYGPSVLVVSPQGQVVRRIIPLGTAASYAEAGYPVADALPALATARKLNRGFEGMALTDDGRHLFLAFQSPLAHPDREAHEQSRHVRLWKLDVAHFALEAEFVYRLDKAERFKRDADAGKVGSDDVKISELIALSDGGLLVLERISRSTKIYRTMPGMDKAAPRWAGDPTVRPTLEQMSPDALKDAGVATLQKQLVFDTDDWPDISADLEGMILLSPTELLLVNDSDFGIEGAETVFWRVTFEHALA